jgi:hypothetical protein
MYFDYRNTLPNIFMQGDIIEKYPFSYIPTTNDYIFIRDNNGAPSLFSTGNEDGEVYNNEYQEEQLVVNSKLNNIILLSQTCDLQRRESIMIAPVFDLSFLKQNLQEEGKNEQEINSQLGLLKNNKFEKQFHYYFYLPAFSGFPERYIDFNLIQSIPRDNIKIEKRILSLSDKGRHWLSYKLNTFFGRPVEF